MLENMSRRRLLLSQAVKCSESPDQVDGMDATDRTVRKAICQDAQRHAIHRGNAERLFPRLRHFE